MKIPEINIKKMKEFKEKNFQERIDFLKKYANWVKKSDPKEWSSQQNKLIK